MQKLGYIKIIISTGSLGEVLSSSNDLPGIAYYLVDSNNNIVYSNQDNNNYQQFYKYFVPVKSGDQAVTQMVGYKRDHYSSVVPASTARRLRFTAFPPKGPHSATSLAFWTCSESPPSC